jgi:tetratricopeptide (TPR) repeat protein
MLNLRLTAGRRFGILWRKCCPASRSSDEPDRMTGKVRAAIMTRPTASNASAQPTIDALMVRFLATRSDAAAAAVESGESEVEPHEVAAGFRVDPRAAWLDATAALTTGGNAPPPAIQPPTEWAALVAQPAAAFALPMAAGHFPQRVKDLQPLLANFNPNELRPSGTQPVMPGFPGLRNWLAKHGSEHPLIAAGIARTLGEFDTAERLFGAVANAANDRAATLWAKGACAEALTAWDAMPESPAVLFNRGMARLFLGQFAEAREWLQKAVDAIPETSGWNALARLYLAVAEIQG